MVNAYTKDDYTIAYAELLEIFNHIPENELKLIPQDIIQIYKQNRSLNCDYTYNESLDLEEQNISHLTKIILANLYIDYFATDEEKATIKNADKAMLYEEELKKRKLYNPDNLFKKDDTLSQVRDVQNVSIAVQKETIFKKFINWLKRVFD